MYSCGPRLARSPPPHEYITYVIISLSDGVESAILPGCGKISHDELISSTPSSTGNFLLFAICLIEVEIIRAIRECQRSI